MTQNNAQKSKVGRPPYTPNEKTRMQVKMLSAMGVRDFDIAKVIGVSTPTMRKYYMAELEIGHIEANAKVAQSLFRQATNPEKPNVSAAIFWLKCRAEWREDGGDRLGKKALQEALSKAADQGTDWEGLLQD